MAAEQRKLLEQLMGADALDRRHKSRERINLYDSRVCKSFLVDACLHDIFAGTKVDLGQCPQLHLEKYKLEYRAQINRGVEFPEFDLEHERTLDKYIMETNRRIDDANRKLEKTPEDIAKINQATAELEEITTEMTMSLKEIELLGRHGEIARALHEMVHLESTRSTREFKDWEIQSINEKSGFSGHQKLQVCSACGAFLSRIDNDKRLIDHFHGRMHQGYVQLRQCYADIKAKNDLRRKRPRD